MRMELENHQPKTELTVNVSKQDQEESQYQLAGKYMRTQGTKLFQFDPDTGILEEIKPHAKSHDVAFILPDGTSHIKDEQKAAYVNASCVLFEAISMKSAAKRVQRWKEGHVKELSNIRFISVNQLKARGSINN